MAKSVAKACLRFTGLFEAELLTELMLRFWNHPFADDASFRSSLLESTAEVLEASIAGERLFDDLDPKNVNFVAALWYVESTSVGDETQPLNPQLELRRKWLDSIARALPSCFCDPNAL